MTPRTLLSTLFAVPALAGFLFLAGCDDGTDTYETDPVQTDPGMGTPTDPGMDPGMDPATDPLQDPANNTGTGTGTGTPQ